MRIPARRSIELLCVAVLLGACAQGVSRAGDPDDFTPEERTLFEERPGYFESHPLPALFPAEVYWFDNDHLIMSALRLPNGWKHSQADDPRIVLVDTRTGTIEATPYNGYIACFQDGQIVIEKHDDSFAAGSADRMFKFVVLKGSYGNKLDRVDKLRTKMFFSAYGCVERTLDNDYATWPLRPEHGVLREKRLPYSVGRLQPMSLIGVNGAVMLDTTVPINMTPGGLAFSWLPFRQRYFVHGIFGNVSTPAGSLIDPKGSIDPIRPPELFSMVGLRNRGNGNVYVSKHGFMWTNRTPFWRTQGLFYEEGKVLMRVDSRAIETHSNEPVSPDGCKFYYETVPGDEFHNPAYKRLDEVRAQIIDVCKEIKK